MKIECIREKLQEAVDNASHFTGKNESLPVLECVYLEAKKGDLVVRATNLELGIEISIPAKISEDGSCAVPGGVFRGLLSGIKGEKKVFLETSKDNLVVSGSQNTSLIKSQKTEDFPTIPKVTGNETFEIQIQDLKRGLESVWYSVSHSFVKPELASVYLYKEGDGMVFVATDSFRLAEKKIPLKTQINFSSMIIPYKNILEIMRVLGDSTGSVEVNSSKNQASFGVSGVYTTSRLVDGVFPDYRQIIPGESTTEVVVLREELIRAIKITNIFADSFSKVLLRVKPSEGVFEVESRNADVGENTTQVGAKVEGGDVDIAFNYRYILDVLQVIGEDSVEMHFSGEGKALVIRGIGDNSFTYLVMPMNR